MKKHPIKREKALSDKIKKTYKETKDKKLYEKETGNIVLVDSITSATEAKAALEVAVKAGRRLGGGWEEAATEAAMENAAYLEARNAQ